jgi:hypothetical protein
MNLVRVNLNNAIATARITMRIERDRRDWLKQAIEKGRKDMTEQQKRTILADIANLAAIADRNGLDATARWWRELYGNVAVRPSAEMILAADHAALIQQGE